MHWGVHVLGTCPGTRPVSGMKDSALTAAGNVTFTAHYPSSCSSALSYTVLPMVVGLAPNQGLRDQEYLSQADV